MLKSANAALNTRFNCFFGVVATDYNSGFIFFLIHRINTRMLVFLVVNHVIECSNTHRVVFDISAFVA